MLCGSRPNGHGLPLLHSIGGLGEEDLECWEGLRWLGPVLHSYIWGQLRPWAERLLMPWSWPGFAHPGSWVLRVSVSRACERVRRKPCSLLFLSPRCHRESPPLPCTGWSCHPGWYSRGGDIDPTSPRYLMGQKSLNSPVCFGSPMCTCVSGQSCHPGCFQRSRALCWLWSCPLGGPAWEDSKTHATLHRDRGAGLWSDWQGHNARIWTLLCTSCLQHQGWSILVPELVLSCYL